MPRKIDHAARKAQLIDALWSVIHQQGMSAVSLRTVAGAAGVSVGSLRHLFPTRDALLVYAAELMIDRATVRVRSVGESSGGSGDTIAAATKILMHLVPTDAQSRCEMEINIALVAESGADPHLVAIRDQARKELAGLFRTVLTGLRPDASSAQTATRVRKLHALVDGMAFQMVQTRSETDHQWAQDILRKELEEWTADH